MSRRFCGALLSVMLATNAAYPATFKSNLSKEGRVVISLDGEIAPGDAENLKAEIQKANQSGRPVSRIRLNSAGGNFLEGVKLAEAIRFARIATVVPKGAPCASACFLAFAAGSEKFASYSASVGVHGVSEPDGRETTAAKSATVSMARVSKELGVPDIIIGKMVVTPPDQIIWLNPNELRAMGAKMTGKPAQVAAEVKPEANQPLPLQQRNQVLGQPQANLQQSAPPPARVAWKDYIESAMVISANQNGGRANVVRSCQPEIRRCNTAVWFTHKGKETIARISENADGKVIERDICEFNAFKDVRTCIDWDTGASSKEMKNEAGIWKQVSE